MTTAVRKGIRFDFDYNGSVSDEAARRAWARIVRRQVATHETRPPAWDRRRAPGPLHEELARHLYRTRAVRCKPEQILLVASPQAAFHSISRLLLNPGERAALEDPHYIGVRNSFRVRGARLLALDSDEHGLRTDRLPRNADVRLLYTAPSHQWPTGASLPISRRLELLDYARKERTWIIENDHNCEYLYDAPPLESLQGLDVSDSVLYVGTFSRLFAPYPSIAYMVVPETLEELFRGELRLAGGTFSELEKESLAEFLRGGEMAKLVRRASRRMRLRRRHVLRTLEREAPKLEPRAASSGLHVYAEVPESSPDQLDSLIERAEARGVALYSSLPFHLKKKASPGLLFGFAQLDDDEIEEGIRVLAPLFD